MPAVGATRRNTPDSRSPSTNGKSLTDALAPAQHLQYSEAASKVKTWADTHGTGTAKPCPSCLFRMLAQHDAGTGVLSLESPGYELNHDATGVRLTCPSLLCEGDRKGVWGISGAAGAVMSLAGTLLLMCCCPAFAIYL